MKKFVLILMLMFTICSLFSQQKIGLALSGGGARGLAHIGVLKVLEEMNIPIDYIAGTSSGAVIGALYSLGYSAGEIETIFLNMQWEEIFDESIKRKDYYIGNKRWKPYADYSFDVSDNLLPQLPQAFLSGNNLINIFFDLTYQYSYIRDFSDFPIPFSCVAADLLTGDTKVFSSGVLHEALRATMSFPSVLQPFTIDDHLYIDGGVTSNLPAEVVKEMGADFIIGIKANSGLKTEEELKTLIDVLDQTVNLSITKNVEKSENLCDILIKPDLQDMSILDFDKKAEIIALGEFAARKYFAEHPLNLPSKKKAHKNSSLPEMISFAKIRVAGNKYLSNAKVREFVGLSTKQNYSKEEIEFAFRDAYNSDLFNYIYPVIDQIDTHYILTIKLQEKNRLSYGLDFCYNEQKEINLSATLRLNNVLQKNSKLLMNLQLGDRQELNLDYVKNFGKHYGVYFRIFPYIKEFNLFSYNSEHQKTNSVRSLEMGGTCGIGLYAAKAFVAEIYSYHFRSKLYQSVAEFTEREMYYTGAGVKVLHEELDDYMFPMKGTELFLKYSLAKKEFYSEFDNKTFFTRLRILLPFSNHFSLKYKFEYGSHFEKMENDLDPFYVGGINDFLGLRRQEKVAPIYKISSVAARLNLPKNVFVDLQMNILNLGNVDYWQPEKYLYKGAGIILGYKSVLGPIRVAAAVDDEFEPYYYFSFGYKFDQFEFSRR